GLCEIFRVFMSDYGFIERFKKEKDYHFRYVGYPHSKIMQNLDLNLEDYLEFLKSYSPNNPYLFQNYKIYYFEVKKNFKIKCSFHTVLSGNNYDGVIVTEKN
ncbi:MAG: M15 family metallopeptidase, partial [Bacilli bacterium]|nr:M15 family metallopeptidase [Bacilli bacterium]